MLGKKPKTADRQESGSEAEGTRKSARLQTKTPRNYDKMNKGEVGEKPETSEHMSSAEQSSSESESNSSGQSRSRSRSSSGSRSAILQDGDERSVDDQTVSESSVNETSSEDEEDMVVKLTKTRNSMATMDRLELESQKRVKKLEKILQEQKVVGKHVEHGVRKATGGQSREAMRRELARLNAELEKKADEIKKLQRHEDNLSVMIDEGMKKSKQKLKQKQHPPAASTPQGGYSDMLQDLLNNSFDISKRNKGRNEIASYFNPSEKKVRQKVRKCASPQRSVAEGRQPRRGTKRHSKSDRDSSSSEAPSENRERGTSRKGKLISGKLAKIDDLDIKLQVKYPHSKLNGEFTTVREFDKLTLNLFAAGEIELILRTGNEQEKQSRLKILLTVLYYSQFLDIKELRDQYDVLMKQIERAELCWSNPLSDRMEQALDRRMWLRDQAEKKSGATGHGDKKSKDKSGKLKEEFVWCHAFNRGTCPESGTHKGKFAGREGVTLNHACNRCLQEKGICVGHAAIDDKCPSRNMLE